MIYQDTVIAEPVLIRAQMKQLTARWHSAPRKATELVGLGGARSVPHELSAVGSASSSQWH